MKLSKLIKEAVVILEKQGDLEVLLDPEGFQVDHISLFVFDEDKKDWNCKKGDKVAMVEAER